MFKSSLCSFKFAIKIVTAIIFQDEDYKELCYKIIRINKVIACKMLI